MFSISSRKTDSADEMLYDTMHVYMLGVCTTVLCDMTFLIIGTLNHCKISTIIICYYLPRIEKINLM